MNLPIFATLILIAAADVKYHVRHDISEQWDKLYDRHKQECIQESGVNKDDVHDLFKRGHFLNKPEFKCYLHCIGIKLNFVTKDGTINEANLQSTRRSAAAADLDTLEHSVEIVKDIKDPCEKFYLYVTIAVSKAAIRYPPSSKIN